jgi:hypothetical protein
LNIFFILLWGPVRLVTSTTVPSLVTVIQQSVLHEPLIPNAFQTITIIDSDINVKNVTQKEHRI